MQQAAHTLFSDVWNCCRAVLIMLHVVDGMLQAGCLGAIQMHVEDVAAHPLDSDVQKHPVLW
jgi:hypothetical protein